MATFTYVARDLEGRDHKGTIETGDERQVAQILGRGGLIVISIRKQVEGGKGLTSFFNKVSFNDLVIATRQLATMIEAGLVLSEAIDILVEQQPNKTFKDILGEVSRDIKGGLDLATAFKKHPEVFPPLYSSLIKAGEESGKLDIVLTQMALNLEKDREFRSRIRGAMIYPIMVVVMMGVVVSIMMFFVIPRLLSLFTQSNIELPLPTKILIAVSNFFTGYWWLMLIFLVVGVITFKRWIAKPAGRLSFDSLMLKTPIVGKIIQGNSLTNFTRTFGLLASAGIPLLNGLEIVNGILGNSVYQKALAETQQGVERGLTFSAQLESTGVFPKIVSQMFRVGEETGKVDKVSFKMAEYFEAETDHLVKNLTVVIEPLVLVVLGIGVAFLVFSIILPIYQLTTSVT
ncbi:type II secretion system F family protein [Candidatus Daviesbacteria bacterium]|nr:type II secretion system F family protein [Candidatus Daviesbacteria bacterium]